MATYGLQLPDFSWIVDADPPTTMDRLRAAAEAAEASRLLVAVGDGSHVATAATRWARRVDPRGLRHARRAGRRDQASRARHARHRRHVPQPRSSRQADRLARCADGRPSHPRDRCRVVRRRARRIRLGLSAGEGTLRATAARRSPSAGACSTTRRSATAGDLLQRRRSAGRATTAATHPDHDRRQRREEDAADGRRARRPVQHRWHGRRGRPTSWRSSTSTARPSGGTRAT